MSQTDDSQGSSATELEPKGIVSSAEEAAAGDDSADEVRRKRRKAEPKAKFASIYPGTKRPLPKKLGLVLEGIEVAFDRPVWLVVQQEHGSGAPRYAHLDDPVTDAFTKRRRSLKDCQEVALVIDSPGGYASNAYELARCVKRHCGGFIAVIPRMAMSAATLLALGADEIYMGQDAKIGPLDAQMFDFEREAPGSALDEVQALERLHSTALEEIDRAMALLLGRTGKKIETLLPMAMSFEAAMMRPMLEKIDTVHYTQQSRVLKVAEDYAIRLLEPNYGRDNAEMIARRLVNAYPEHGFVIDREEAGQFLAIEEADEKQDRAIEDLADALIARQFTLIGRLEGGSNGIEK